jgi:hypothetical protein
MHGSVSAYQEQMEKQGLCPVAIRHLPPWLFPTSSSVNLIRSGAILLPPITAGIFTDVLKFRVDPGKNGIFKWLANQYIGGGFTDGSGAIIWRILYDGKTVPGLGDIDVSLGTNQNPREIAPVRLKAQRIVQLQVTNASIVPAGQIISGSIAGWMYPQDEEAPGTLY